MIILTKIKINQLMYKWCINFAVKCSNNIKIRFLNNLILNEDFLVHFQKLD